MTKKRSDSGLRRFWIRPKKRANTSWIRSGMSSLAPRMRLSVPCTTGRNRRQAADAASFLPLISARASDVSSGKVGLSLPALGLAARSLPPEGK